MRATREHRDLRTGSSVRGAIDLVLLLGGLLRLRGGYGLSAPGARETARDATHAALSGRVRVSEGVERTPESVLDEILDEVWPEDAPPPEEEEPPGSEALAEGAASGKGEGLPAETAGPETESASALRRDRRSGGARRQTSRRELEMRHAAFDEVSPEVGELDEEAFAELMGQDPDAAAALLVDMALAMDRDLRDAAHRLACRVFIQVGRVGRTRIRGTRRLVHARYTDGDLDLDRTLDRWSGTWPPSTDDLVTRRWSGARRAVCLVVDSSGSMNGLAVALAAVAAAGVVLAADERLQTSVLTFSGKVEVLQRMGQRRPAEQLVGQLVGLRGHGMTHLAAALRAARTQLLSAVADERVVVLLSDCLHTTGDAPQSALAGIDRLHVLCPLPTPEAEIAARALAAPTGGTTELVRTLRDVGPALTRVLG